MVMETKQCHVTQPLFHSVSDCELDHHTHLFIIYSDHLQITKYIRIELRLESEGLAKILFPLRCTTRPMSLLERVRPLLKSNSIYEQSKSAEIIVQQYEETSLPLRNPHRPWRALS
jgi:hypothetical protein